MQNKPAKLNTGSTTAVIIPPVGTPFMEVGFRVGGAGSMGSDDCVGIDADFNIIVGVDDDDNVVAIGVFVGISNGGGWGGFELLRVKSNQS